MGDFEFAPVHHVAAWGFALAAVFGFVANKTNFCTMGAVSDLLHMGSRGRLGAWFFAMGLAILGAQALHAADLVDLAGAMYLTPNFGWLGYVVGGIAFGVGMTLAAGCGQRNLVRFGGGNLKALVVLLVLGITAYTTVRGLLGLARITVFEAPNVDLEMHGLDDQGLATLLAPVLGLDDAGSVRTVLAVLLGGGPHRVRARPVEFSAKPGRPARGYRHRRGHHRWLVRHRLHRQRRLRAGAARIHDVRRPDRKRHQLPDDLHRFDHQLRNCGGARDDRRLVRLRGDVGQLPHRDLRYPRGDGEPPCRRTADGFRRRPGPRLHHRTGVTGVSTLAAGSLIAVAGIIFGSAITMKVEYHMLDEKGFLAALGAGLKELAMPWRAGEEG